MVTGIEGQIVRAAGKAVVQLVPHAIKAIRRRALLDDARTVTPISVAATAFGELTPEQTRRLTAYLSAPEFEQTALRLVLTEWQSARVREETVETIKSTLKYGLQHQVGLPPSLLLRIRDLIFDSLRIECATVLSQRGPVAQDPGFLPSLAAHVAAASVRNGELLGRLGDLARIETLAARLRGQIAGVHADIRLPHTGVNRAVPWSQLYVQPELAHEKGRRLDFRHALETLTAPGNRMVILGDPGAGKSTLTEKLAHDIASVEGRLVPFRVVLRNLSMSFQSGQTLLTEHLISTAREPYNIELDRDTVEYLLLNGRAVVILDGLDELTDMAQRSRMAKLIESFVILYPMTPVIVTSRRIGYQEAPLHPSWFETWQITQMDEDRLCEYARNWFILDESVPRNERERLAESFIAESDALRDLRSNPLLLSLLCATYSTEQYIPRNRAQVYEKCAVLIFDRWDSMRGIPMAYRFQGHVRGAVQELAWRLFNDDGGAVLPRWAVVDILVKHLTVKGFDEDEAVVTAEKFLEFCAGRAWVLAEVGSMATEPIYGFAHRTFLEYFAAEHLVRHHPDPGEVCRKLKPHITEGKWEVVAQLTLQLLDRNRNDGAEAILDLLLDSIPNYGKSLRRGLYAFLSRTCGELVLSPNVIRRIVKSAVASADSVPFDERRPFWRGTSSPSVELADDPLRSLLTSSLESNLEHIRRHLADQVADDVLHGNPLILPVVRSIQGELAQGGMALGNALDARLSEEHDARLREWRRTHAWAPDDARSPEQILRDVGIQSFYRWPDESIGGGLPPAAALIAGRYEQVFAAERFDPYRLAAEFRDLPCPWLPSGTWRSRFIGDPPIGDARFGLASMSQKDLGARLVFCLPYLEVIAHTDLSWTEGMLAGTAWALIEHRRRGLMAIPHHQVPGDVWTFLLRWARHEFSVIG